MKLLDVISEAAGRANEDRAGARGRLAWVIDGATDVLDEPLITSHPSDASWIAEHLHAALDAGAECEFDAINLASLPRHLSALLQPRFQAAAFRAPRARHELPSAAGLVVRHEGSWLGYVALADCSLLAVGAGRVARWGVRADDAGDKRLAGTLARHRAAAPGLDPAALRQRMRGELQRSRDTLNTAEGYGVFSVVPPLDEHVTSGTIDTCDVDHVLIATDGFMRLVDVFAVYTPDALLRAALSVGLAPLVAELRDVERQDASGNAHPRVKASDDASAVLLALRD